MFLEADFVPDRGPDVGVDNCKEIWGEAGWRMEYAKKRVFRHVRQERVLFTREQWD